MNLRDLHKIIYTLDVGIYFFYMAIIPSVDDLKTGIDCSCEGISADLFFSITSLKQISICPYWFNVKISLSMTITSKIYYMISNFLTNPFVIVTMSIVTIIGGK